MEIVNMGQKIEKGAFDTKEACSYLSMNRKKLDSLRKQNIIKCIKFGKGYYYPKSELDAFLTNYLGQYVPYYA